MYLYFTYLLLRKVVNINYFKLIRVVLLKKKKLFISNIKPNGFILMDGLIK